MLKNFFDLLGKLVNILDCKAQIDYFPSILDETLSWKVCLLLSELDLCTFQVGHSFLIVYHSSKLQSDFSMKSARFYHNEIENRKTITGGSFVKESEDTNTHGLRELII